MTKGSETVLMKFQYPDQEAVPEGPVAAAAHVGAPDPDPRQDPPHPDRQPDARLPLPRDPGMQFSSNEVAFLRRLHTEIPRAVHK